MYRGTFPNIRVFSTFHSLSRSQGVQWVHLRSQGGKKNFRCDLQKNLVGAPPGRARGYFRTPFARRGIWGYLEVYLIVAARLLRATTKKVNFFRKKVHPRQNPGYAYEQCTDRRVDGLNDMRNKAFYRRAL